VSNGSRWQTSLSRGKLAYLYRLYRLRGSHRASELCRIYRLGGECSPNGMAIKQALRVEFGRTTWGKAE
jgi:hypothetical protein